MEEVKSLILQTCNMVKELEETLPDLSHNPVVLSRFCNDCDDIITAFFSVKQSLISLGGESARTSTSDHMHAHSMDVVGMATPQGDQWSLLMADDVEMLRYGVQQEGEDSETLRRDISERELANVPRQRRRRDASDNWQRVPAPEFGNTDIPPEDGYTWRKYGQKAIFGSHFPRSYYRCTHRTLYDCPAKKQVQRLDDDPRMFGVLYRGSHTCIVSNTLPSQIQLQQPTDVIISTASELIHSSQEAQHEMIHALPLTSVAPGWLPGGNDGAGPSNVTHSHGYGRSEANEYPMMVADIAETMFNSGSGSGNSMGFLFHSTEEKWDEREKKN